MRPHPQFGILLFLLSCVLPLCANQAGWLKLRSEHFEIFSAEDDKKARKVLEHLERVRKAYELLTNVKINSAERVRVLLFRNENEYREYAPDKLSMAYYMSARDRDYIVLSGFDGRTETVLNHEYFHLFSQHAGFQFPVWLEEGLADFYSTLKIGSKDVRQGYPVASHLRYLNSMHGRPMPLDQLFAINRENRHHGSREVTGRLYAQGWALAHMTFQGSEMRARSQEFFEKVKDGSTGSASAYLMVYGYTTQQLDELLRKYVGQQGYFFGITEAEGLDFEAPTETAVIEDWETPLLLADMLAYTGKHDRAMVRYDDLALAFPSRPEIEESRGYLAMQRDRRDEALAFYRAAAGKKSRNSMLYYHLAGLGCEYRIANEECRNWISEALRLDPGNRKARDWAIGYALNTHDYRGAVALLTGSGGVAAADAPEFFHKLAYAQYQLRDFKEARSALQRGLKFAAKPEHFDRLNEMERHIDNAERFEAEDAQSAGSGGGARSWAAEESAGQVRQGVPTEIEKSSSASQAVQQLMEQEGARMTAATMLAMDCSGAPPAVLLKAKGAPLRLAIDKLAAVVVIRNGEVVADYEFVCGKQPSAALLVGYLEEGAPKGSDGLLRILSFP